MEEVGAFTPDQARLLWLDYQERKQLNPQISQNFPQRRRLDEPSPHRVFVKNASGEEIPSFGCMEITGTEEVGERTVVTVTKPTGTSGEYLFNSQFPIEVPDEDEDISGCGWAYRFGVVIMLGTPPADIAQYRPIVSSWEIEEGSGPFVVFGEHTVVEGALIGRFQSNQGGVIEYKIISTSTKASGPYTGLKAAQVIIHGAPCNRPELIGEEVEVIDHSNNLFDETSMVDYTGWAAEMRFLSLASGAECDELTPCHWAAINRVCEADTGTYAAPCE